MKTYSLDLRERIVDAIDRRIGTQGEIAQQFSVSTSFIRKLLTQRRQTGSFAPKPHGGGMPLKVDEESAQVLRELVAAQPDASLESLCREMVTHSGVQIGVATMFRAVERLALTRKKNVWEHRTADGSVGPSLPDFFV